jgi:hypothetical protein
MSYVICDEGGDTIPIAIADTEEAAKEFLRRVAEYNTQSYDERGSIDSYRLVSYAPIPHTNGEITDNFWQISREKGES